MHSCDEQSVTVLRYLDHDLSREESERFTTHLETCAGCKQRVEEEKALTGILHTSRPLYTAPAALRARVADIFAEHSNAKPSPENLSVDAVDRDGE
jgi:mycothiol system anti-sigma-R factor